MIIKTLVENVSFDKEIQSRHGLSLYIETKENKILFDLGSDNLFLENAQKLNVDLKAIDTVIISHGHFDHGGALKQFLDINDKAKIYVHKNAFDDYYMKLLCFKISIGLDKSLVNSDRFIFTDSLTTISPDLILFSEVTGRKYFSLANKSLLKKVDGKYMTDDFAHEQNLIIKENGKIVLISGCCHNGIINTLEKAKELGYDPDNIISGFHFLKMNLKKHHDILENVANELNKYKAITYTCHCTGYDAYTMMQEILKDKIKYLSCGSVIEL